MEYNQFCPVSKASEMLGERWTLLIIRELLMGARRFSELQRGLAKISPTVLTKRLGKLTARGLIVRKRVPGQRGYEYFLSEAGKELEPVVEALGAWGLKWARGRMEDSDLDVELLMLYLARSIDPGKLVGDETIIRFTFRDLKRLNTWWLLVHGGTVEACLDDPGKEADVRFDVDLRTMVEIWMGDRTYRSALREGKLRLYGPRGLTRNVTDWMANSRYAGMAPATEI